jgi:hypothetical protein
MTVEAPTVLIVVAPAKRVLFVAKNWFTYVFRQESD